jgi:NAD(P)H-hydrate epimerase
MAIADDQSELNPDPQGMSTLLTAAEMRQADALAVGHGIPSWTLMQQAGKAVAREARLRWDQPATVVACGPGNNGGDGFVAANHLRHAGWPVRIALLGHIDQLKGDAARAASLWNAPIEELTPGTLERAELVIDALFGAGLTRPLEGPAGKFVEAINARKLPCLSVDLPSGVDGDDGRVLGQAPQAHATVTFFRRKPGHLLYPGRALAGELVVRDIGIPPEVLTEIAPRQFENSPELWRGSLRKRHWGDHKYKRGSLLIAGGDVMTGAARLAARAARRVGAGLVAIVSGRAAHPIYALDSAGTVTLAADSDAEFQELVADPRRTAFLIGPGYGLGAVTRRRTLAILQTRKPAVLDADALSSFATDPDELFQALHPAVVLTPHEGEFARLFPDIATGLGKPARARTAAARSRATVVLKGPDTVIASPNGFLVINSNAPPWLAMGGAGDVLAGLTAGLMALGLRGELAAMAGVWLQGQAALLNGESIIVEDLDAGIKSTLREIFDT